MGKGERKIQKLLDYKSIVKNHNQLKTLLAMQMTEKQRKLITLQRRSRILEQCSSEDEDADHYLQEFINDKLDEDTNAG